MSDWIKIKDELPQVGRELWVWDGKECSQWKVNSQCGKTDDELRKFFAKYNITHWQLFITPESPK